MNDKNDNEILEDTSLNVTYIDDKNDKDKLRKQENIKDIFIEREKERDFKEFQSNLSNNNYLKEEDIKYIEGFNTNINSIQEKIIELISQEKENLITEMHQISKVKQSFNEYKENETKKLKNEKEIWLNTFYKERNLNNDIIDLNISGIAKVSTLRATICKYPFSALALLFSGNYDIPKYENRLFIDRPPEAFIHMLSYLRTGKYPIFKEKHEEINFFRELEFWKIPEIEVSSNNDLQEEFDSEWCAPTLILEGDNKVIKKNNKDHGIVFCKHSLDGGSYQIDFKINMITRSRGKSHLFIGLVDKTKYKLENLISTYWKDSPSSFYWDVWSNKLIKTDDKGNQVSTLTGYGCLCEDLETIIGMKYNHIDRSIMFFKDGINQGVAFKNIPSNMYPSLDIWFESGSVEILKNIKLDENKNYL